MNFSSWLLSEEKENFHIMYHGSSMASWEDIRQNGLNPFPEKRSWDEDPNVNFNHASRASYGGVYLTTNLLTATSSAFRTAQKTKTNRLLIAIKIDRRTLIADEDSVTYHAGKLSIPGMATTDYTVCILYSSFKEGEDDFVKKSREEYVNQTMRMLLYKLPDSNLALKIHLEKLLRDVGFEAVLTRLAAHTSTSSRNYLNSEVKFPTVQEGEAAYRKFIDKLTFLLRRLADPDTESIMHSARTMKKIDFNGKSRIVYAAKLIRTPYITDFGSESTKDTPVRLYGEPPIELIKQWEERIGTWEEVK